MANSKAQVMANAARRNIRAIAHIEKEALRQRSFGERFSDAVARVAGRMWFVWLHIAWFVAWILYNTGVLHGKPFDPFPFQLLTLVVSLEAIFLSLFILISQNRLNRQSDQRTHLDLQVNLLAEFETTKMLQMLQALCEYHGLPESQDKDVLQLVTRTEPHSLLRELKAQLPESC